MVHEHQKIRQKRGRNKAEEKNVPTNDDSSNVALE
jgi:hypothetical protein